jgi:hypothetical protein
LLRDRTSHSNDEKNASAAALSKHDPTRPIDCRIPIRAHTGAHGASIRLAHQGPNDVLVSSTLRDLVIGSGLEFEDRGTHQLKGVPGEWRLFAVAST